MGTVLHFHQTTESEGSNNLKGKVKVERQLVGLPWAADCCPWVGKLRDSTGSSKLKGFQWGVLHAPGAWWAWRRSSGRSGCPESPKTAPG
jgi:hypothetical protein